MWSSEIRYHYHLCTKWEKLLTCNQIKKPCLLVNFPPKNNLNIDHSWGISLSWLLPDGYILNITFTELSMNFFQYIVNLKYRRKQIRSNINEIQMNGLLGVLDIVMMANFVVANLIRPCERFMFVLTPSRSNSSSTFKSALSEDFEIHFSWSVQKKNTKFPTVYRTGQCVVFEACIRWLIRVHIHRGVYRWNTWLILIYYRIHF